MNEIYFFAEIFPQLNLMPCKHYINKILLPLAMTCKTLYIRINFRKCYLCQICHFRDVICERCSENGTKACAACCCKKCNISCNLTGEINVYGTCDACYLLCSASEKVGMMKEQMLEIKERYKLDCMWQLYSDDLFLQVYV